MEESLQNKIEEWKIVRSTIVEFDHILSNIRSLDITATIVLLGVALKYSCLFLLVSAFNICLLLLEYHYHKYLNETAKYAMELEDEIGFKLTHKITDARNKYKDQGGKITYILDSFTAKVYYWIYLGFIFFGLFLFLLSYAGNIKFVEGNSTILF
jgi:hypothetical protein